MGGGGGAGEDSPRLRDEKMKLTGIISIFFCVIPFSLVSVLLFVSIKA